MPSTRSAHHSRSLVLGLVSLALACRPAPSDPPEPRKSPPASVAESVDEILAASDLPPEQPRPIEGDSMGVTVHRLQNGMTVYVSTDRRKPEIAAWIAVRTGARNDPPDSTGLAHYLEHMLFKGTDELGTTDMEAERPHLERIAGLYDELRKTDDAAARAKLFAAIDRETQATAPWAIPGEFSRIYGSLGISDLNAFTTDDATAYVATIPTNRLEAWAEVEVERFRDVTFRLFYPELESVYEEKNRSIDEPADQIDEALRLGLFPRHPYGTQPVLGLPEHLKTPAYADMVAYLGRWYAPNNMAILLAGDVDARAALPVLEATLGTLAPRPLQAPPTSDLGRSRGRSFHEVVGEGEESVAIAWRTVGGDHPDEPTLAVLDLLVDNSTSGLLNVELELTQKVPDASSWPTTLRESGYWTMSATAREGQSLEEVEQLLLGVVAKLAAGEIEQRTIDAILLHEDIDDKLRLESNDERVEKLLDAYINRRTWPQVLERDARLRGVTKEDVVAAAKRYLGDDRAVVYRRRGTPTVPKIDKPTITPFEGDGTRQSAFGRKIAALPAKTLEPEWLVEGEHYERHVLPSGPLVVVPNPRNDLFQLTLTVDRGIRKAPLLCHAIELLQLSGTKGRSPQALRDELYALGTTIEFGCGADETSILVAGLDRNMDASLALLAEWLDDPRFDAETLAGLNDNVLSMRRDALDDPAIVEHMLRDHALFGDTSAWKAAPRNRDLIAAKPKALARLVRGLLDYRRDTYYFGPRSGEEARGALARMLRGNGKDPGPYPKLDFREVSEPTFYFVHKEVAKTAIHLAIPQGVLPHDRIPEAVLLDEYVDGDMSSLLFVELRENRGLVYEKGGYQSISYRPGDEWAFIGRMKTQGDKTVEALEVYLELVRRPIAESRLAAARQALDQDYRSTRVDPRYVADWIRYWDLRGEKGDPRPWEWTQGVALDVAGLDRLVETLRERPVVVGLVGDRARVDLRALAKLGKLVEVDVGELTSYGAFPRE